MKVLLFVCVLAVIPAAAGAAQAKSRAAAAAPTGAGRTVKAARTIEITGGDTLKYDLASIQAHPGERLHVVLKSNGTAPKIVMGHNFVLLKAGVKPEDFVNAAMNARATDFIPPDMQDKVIAAKGLVGPGETVVVDGQLRLAPGMKVQIRDASGAGGGEANVQPVRGRPCARARVHTGLRKRSGCSGGPAGATRSGCAAGPRRTTGSGCPPGTRGTTGPRSASLLS